MRRVAIFGAGAVGGKLADYLRGGFDEVVFVTRHPDLAGRQADFEARAMPAGPSICWLNAGAMPDCEVGIICLPTGLHASVARSLLRQGSEVVSVADSVQDVRALLALNDEAVERGRRVVVGAGFAPGLSDVLAGYGAARFDEVTQVHVAKQGTGGPACARQHHAALKRPSWDYREGGWLRRPGGSGRELVWFPSPIDGFDSYRAELADALLLARSQPGVDRVSARMAATRRDRFTSWLPMLAPPHAEGLDGSIRVEVRGVIGGCPQAQVFGVAAPPAQAAAMVAASVARWITSDHAASAPVSNPACGARGLAEWIMSGPFLRDLHSLGLRVETFEGRSAYEHGPSR